MGLMGETWFCHDQRKPLLIRRQLEALLGLNAWIRRFRRTLDRLLDFRFSMLSEHDVHAFLAGIPLSILKQSGLESEFRASKVFRARFFLGGNRGISICKDTDGNSIFVTYAVRDGAVHIAFKDQGHGKFGNVAYSSWSRGGSFSGGGLATFSNVQAVYRYWWRQRVNIVVPIEVETEKKAFEIKK